jgi:hypothetical protein
MQSGKEMDYRPVVQCAVLLIKKRVEMMSVLSGF